MMKSCAGVCVAVCLSLAMILPTTIVSANQAQAPGGLYTGNCASELESALKLEKGLGTLNDMIDRTDRQLDGIRKNGGRQNADAANQAAEAKKALAADNAVSVLANIGELTSELEKLAKFGPPGKAVSVLKAIGEMKKLENGYKVTKAAIAAGNYKFAAQDAQSLMEQVSAAGRFLDDVGLTGELASIGAARAGLAGSAAGLSGLVGGLAITAGVYAIDTIVAQEDSFQNAVDMARAADTINHLRANRSDIQNKIASIRSTCAPQPQRTDPPKQVSQTPPPAPPAASSVAKAGPSAAKAITLVTVGAAGVAGAIVYGPQLISGLSGPDCSAQESAMNNSANSLVAASNSLSSCGSNVTCLNSRLGTVNSGINSLINAAGNMCICMGSTQLSAADKAVVVDLLAQLRALGTSTGSLPSCFR